MNKASKVGFISVLIYSFFAFQNFSALKETVEKDPSSFASAEQANSVPNYSVPPEARQALSPIAPPIQDKVGWSILKKELKGAARSTTGGLGKEIYKVTTLTDNVNVKGSLRYGVERFAKERGGAWIVFDKKIFPAEKAVELYLNQELSFAESPNVTIDGRGSHVVIRRKYYWEDAVWSPIDYNKKTPVTECQLVDSPKHPKGPIFALRRAKNVIITHIEFKHAYVGTEPYKGVSKDKQCFGDGIEISVEMNKTGAQNSYFDKIWINHSVFENCGDECISVTRTASMRKANITISNSHFKNAYKSIIVGGWFDTYFNASVSIYGNRFEGMKQRSPRVFNQYAHVFNNLYEEYGSYGVNVVGDAQVIIENNVVEQKNLKTHFIEKNDDDLKHPSTGVVMQFKNNKAWNSGNIFNGSPLSQKDYPSDSDWPKDSLSGFYRKGMAANVEKDPANFIKKVRSNIGAGWILSKNPAQ